jgi:hypothetical protein
MISRTILCASRFESKSQTARYEAIEPTASLEPRLHDRVIRWASGSPGDFAHESHGAEVFAIRVTHMIFDDGGCRSYRVLPGSSEAGGDVI